MHEPVNGIGEDDRDRVGVEILIEETSEGGDDKTSF